MTKAFLLKREWMIVCINLFLVIVISAHNSGQKPLDVMTCEEYAKVHHTYPYIVEIQAGEAALLYFGSQHISDPKHPQNEQIQKLWQVFRPSIAFNEGGNPPVEKSVEEAVSRFEEPGLVRFLASRDHVPVRSLEPGYREEASMLLKSYSCEQIKVYYALRQVLNYGRSKNDTTIEEYMEGFLKWLSTAYGLESAPNSTAELEKSCWRLLNLRNWREVEKEWLDPARDKPLTYMNEMACLSSRFRDRHMINLLASEVKQGKRVFAVVGGSHVLMQEGALKAALGSK